MELNLVKYCKTEHLVDAIEKGRIFIGTFDRYRQIENEALRDTEEGCATPAILNEQGDMLISENDNDTLLAYSSIKITNEWKINLPKGMPLLLDQPSFNTFIYCVSNDHQPSIEKAKRLGYDTFFKITDPVQFGRALMSSLSQQYNSQFGMKCYFGLVNYVPRKIQVVNRQSKNRPIQSFSVKDFFTKHERFREDREFRYVIFEYSNSGHTEYNSFKVYGKLIENIEISKYLSRTTK
ncbi:MAG: hypothetical protein CDV28_11739 [Candidatus Electronema aureum]|uniref:Uncharacterized protein n=1 Tax=Candidatus Electronema aureum TaxID=2005002 RepID=A0A521G192_9BACT|nr:MAG: hypothetical protein CDV28_11739 [Candidatus Electronema aureum]